MKNAREFANYKKTLAARKVIVLAESGSRVLGLASDEKSDIDEMGIVLETPADVLGFDTFETDVYRTAAERTGNFDAKSEAGDIDLVLYGLRKFVRLAVSGNPNVIAMLYVPEDKCRIYTPLARELQAIASYFISKRVLSAFTGYMAAQRLRLLGLKGGMRVNRDNAAGFDTKYAMHMIRLGMQGYEYALNGYLSFPLASDKIKYLTSIRNGFHSLEYIIESAEKYEDAINDALQKSDFPEKPALNSITSWLTDVFMREWREQHHDANIRD